ncbi:MAG: type II secretion system F family protein [bacterium]|jgi:type II secretory pathway component PulF
MAEFRYTALTGGPAGVIDAPDRPTAVRMLVARGITPGAVEPTGTAKPAAKSAAKSPPAPKPAPSKARTAAEQAGLPGAEPAATEAPAAAPATAAPRGRAAMGLSDMASFIRELATAVQAGLPIVPALRTLGKSGRNAAQSAMLAHLIAEVETGRTLAQACTAWGKPFNELTINLIRAGEASGKLGDVLHQAADLLERELQLRRTLLQATLYPVILLGLVSIAIVIVTTVIVPQILEPLKGQNITLPLPTRMVQGFAWFVGSYWWAIAGALGAAFLLLTRAHRQPESRLAIDRFILRLPLFGPLVRDASVARFTRTLGTLVRSGLPVLTGLRLTGATMTNHALRQAISGVCDEVSGGKTIAEPLEKTGVFPPLLVQIVSLGERSGKLPELLGQAADSLEGRTQSRIKVLTTILPPILVVLVACVVGVVVAAILLPLLEMQDAAARL